MHVVGVTLASVLFNSVHCTTAAEKAVVNIAISNNCLFTSHSLIKY